MRSTHTLFMRDPTKLSEYNCFTILALLKFEKTILIQQSTLKFDVIFHLYLFHRDNISWDTNILLLSAIS